MFDHIPALTWLTPRSLAQPHTHAHGHTHNHGHHEHAALPATPGHFLSRNPCDAEDFSEICACCQGAIDVDELVGLKAAAPHEPLGAAHDHFRLQPRLPTGRAGWTLATATAWATLPGLYFGVQNFRAAHSNVHALDHTLKLLTAAAPAAEVTAPATEEARNRAAYAQTLQQSRSMQRFISVFAGALPLLGSMCMLGSVVVPLLGTVGSGFLLAYCASHMARYLTYEWPRVTALSQQVALAPGPQPKATAMGLAASGKLLAQRTRLYPTVAAAFAIYGMGAAMLSASVLVAPALLVPLGAGTLATGLAAVVYLNNGPIKAAYGKNQDRDINRRTLGSQEQILGRVAAIDEELAQLDGLRQAVQAAPREPGTASRQALLRLVEGVTVGLSYGLTFGLCTFGRDDWQQRRRADDLAALAEPEAVLQKHGYPVPPEALVPQHGPQPTPQAHLYRLLYERPEKLTHIRGALLDHFHARVALEGINVGAA